MNRSSVESVLCNKTFVLVQNARSGFSHPDVRKMLCKIEIKCAVKSGDDLDIYMSYAL